MCPSRRPAAQSKTSGAIVASSRRRGRLARLWETTAAPAPAKLPEECRNVRYRAGEPVYGRCTHRRQNEEESPNVVRRTIRLDEMFSRLSLNQSPVGRRASERAGGTTGGRSGGRGAVLLLSLYYRHKLLSTRCSFRHRQIRAKTAPSHRTRTTLTQSDVCFV